MNRSRSRYPRAWLPAAELAGPVRYFRPVPTIFFPIIAKFFKVMGIRPVHSQGCMISGNRMDQQSDSESTSGSNTSWVNWFLELKGNEFFCKIDESYLLDKFNLTGLSYESPLFKKAYDVIIDDYGIPRDPILLDDEDSDDIKVELDKAAKHFYGLIHSRFILATSGLSKMVIISRYLLARKIHARRFWRLSASFLQPPEAFTSRSFRCYREKLC